jgi:hypothetical protein
LTLSLLGTESPSAAGSAISRSQQPQMIKSLTALAIFALLGAAVVALPGFAPQVEARESIGLAKGDRLAIRPVARNCSQQVWPSFDTPCLRKSEPGVTMREVRW